jgi:hypothetical protein
MPRKKSKRDIAVEKIASLLIEHMEETLRTLSRFPQNLVDLSVAESLHDLRKARVLVLYPMLTQKAHKFPLVSQCYDAFQLAQHSVSL